MTATGIAAALRSGLEKSGCDAALVVASSASDPDLAGFVGSAHLGEVYLVVPRRGAPHLVYSTEMERGEVEKTGLESFAPSVIERRLGAAWRESSLAARWDAALREAGVDGGRLALAGRPPVGPVIAAVDDLRHRGWEVTDGSRLLLHARRHKGAEVLTAVRGAATAVGEAFRLVASLLAAAGRREGVLRLEGESLRAGRLRAEIAAVFARRGLGQPHGNIVASGADSALPHSQGASSRAVTAGETLVVDLFPKGFAYADCTRTFCVGQPPEAVAAGHEAVLAALEGAHRQACVGAAGHELQQAACRLFEKRGYPTPISTSGTQSGYVHGLGHGVGFDLHELPSFAASNDDEDRLREGDVFTLEPGLYDPEAGWGIRLEDLCHLGPDGRLENLTPLPYDLDPRAWA